MTTADYLNQLQQDKEDLVDNLEAKGITGLTGDETFTELVPEVSNIKSEDYYFNTRFTSGTIGYHLVKNIPDKILIGGFVTDLSYGFAYWQPKLVLPEIDMSNVTSLSNFFLNLGRYAKVTGYPPIDLSKLKNINNLQDLSGMFSGATWRDFINLDVLNVSSVTDVSAMFSNFDATHTNLLNLDLSFFDKIHPTTMQQMFSNSKFVSIDLRNIDTSNVTDMSYMFNLCSKLTSLNVSSFDTSNVTNMQQMFSGCSGLTTLDVSNFNTSNVTNMQSMFYNSSNLTNLDLSNFVSTSLTSASSMFNSTNKLAVLDISKMTFSTLTGSVSGVFRNCGVDCLQSDGAYADGIPYVYVKDATEQNWVLTASNNHPSSWTTANVVIKQN